MLCFGGSFIGFGCWDKTDIYTRRKFLLDPTGLAKLVYADSSAMLCRG